MSVLSKSREPERCQLLLFYLMLLLMVASGLQAGDRMRGEMAFQHWRPRLEAFLLQIRARAVTGLGLIQFPRESLGEETSQAQAYLYSGASGKWGQVQLSGLVSSRGG